MALTRQQQKAIFAKKQMLAKKFKVFDPTASFQIIPDEPKEELMFFKESKEYSLWLAKHHPSQLVRQTSVRSAINASQNIRRLEKKVKK